MWYIGFPGNKQAEEFVEGAVDKAREVAGIVGGVASLVAETTLKIHAPFNPIAKKILEAYFESPEPDPTDALAEAQYPPQVTE